MSPKQIIFLSVIFVCALVLVTRLIVKYRLREVYAVIWVIVVLTLPGAVLLYPFLTSVSEFVGIESPLNFAFFMGFVALFGISLHYSVLNTGMQRTLKNVAQRLAILEEEVTRLRGGGS